MQEEKINERRKKGAEAPDAAVLARRAKWLSRLRRAALETCWGIGAWLIGQAPMLFGTYPLGAGLLCGTGGHTLSVLAGLLLSTARLGEMGVIYLCAYLAAALVRVLSGMLLELPDAPFSLPEALEERLFAAREGEEEREGVRGVLCRLRAHLGGTRARVLLAQVRYIFSESVCLRMGAASVAALLVALYRIISGGFRYYDLFGAVFSVAVAASATAVFSVATDTRTHADVLRRISEAALLFSAIYAASGIGVLSLPLAPLLSLFATLAVCRTRGGAQGILSGVLCGLAVSPLRVPAYLLAALLYLFFHRLEKENAALLLAAGASVAWMTYAEGAFLLFWAVPVSLIACVLFTVYSRLAETGETAEAAETGESLAMGEVRYRDANERLRAVSDAFSALSEVFYNLSDRLRRPGTLDLRRVCDGAFDAVCADCPNKTVCWGLEYTETLGTLNGMISALHTKGSVSEQDVEGSLLSHCSRAEALLSHVNRECARLTEEMLRNNRTEIFAMDYEGAAQIINEALLCEEGEYVPDLALGRRISVYLSDAGISSAGVAVFGRRCRRILIRGADVEESRVSAETLRSDLSEMCECELLPPVIEVEGGGDSMVFRARRRLSVTVARRNVSADGGVSGDSINLFVNQREYFYALISDGMGAGREAALTSGLCSVFMEKMLRAGNRAVTSLRMLNNLIRSRGADSTNECSTTVDLLELDLMTGQCTFFKSGAAPSFIIRDGVVRRIQSGSIPIGILCSLDSGETAFDLRVGDTVVMVSDGVLDTEGESDALVARLAENAALSPTELVRCICEEAVAREGHDDLSAVVLSIGEYAGG